MLKTKAINLLGGTPHSAAEAIGVTYQAVVKWPEHLPPRLLDRVIAALVKQKKRVPADLLRAAEVKVA